MLLALLAALGPSTGAWTEPSLHNGPPYSVQVEVEQDSVLLMFNGEQQFANGPLGLDPEERYRSPAPAEVQAALDAGALEHFASAVQLSLDGQAAEPALEKALFFEAGLDNFEPIVEVWLRYPCTSVPEQLDLVWSFFPPDGKPVPGVVRRGEFDFQFFQLSEGEPGTTWYPLEVELEPGALVRRPVAPGAQGRSPLAWLGLLVLALGVGLVVVLRALALRLAAGVLSVASAGLLVAWASALPGPIRMPTEDEAVALFGGLHTALYGSLSARSEDEMYAILASAVDEAYIEELYLELRESMIRRNDGGAWCQVTGILDLGYSLDLAQVAEDADALAFEIDWRWQVDGEVTHFGHTHTRRNVHHARYAVAHDGAGWKIKGRRVLEHQRSDDGEELYELDPPPDGEDG